MFFALWPDQALRHEIEHRLSGLLPAAGRRVPPANLHITLLFLGPIADHLLACVEHTAAQQSSDPFELVLDRVAWWRTSQVLWLGGADTPAALADFVRRLHAGIGACGIALESRPFRAHMTLMRKVRRRPALRSIEPLGWKPQDYALVESVPDGAGVRYRTLASWPLG